MRLIIGILTIFHGVITIILGFAPNPYSTSYSLGEFWTEYAGSWLLADLGLTNTTISLIAIVLSLLAGISLILAGMGILEIINFGSLIEEFVFMAILLCLILFIVFFFPLALISIAFNLLLILYLMFLG